MSEDSIAQTDAAAEPERWWFTFGSGQTHPLTGADLSTSYLVLEGTYDETREAMLASPFGRRWAFQYASAAKAGVGNYQLRQVPMPSPGDVADSKIWSCPEPGCGYHIADGPTADGEQTTDDLIAEHLEEHTYDDAAPIESLDPLDEWPQPDVAEAVELVDELPEPESERAAYTRGLREIADWLDAHPEVELPYLNGNVTGKYENVLQIFLGSWSDNQREQLAAAGRAMGQFEKHARENGDRFTIYKRFGGIVLAATADREEVCERVVVATREVTEEVPDPEALAAVPMVTMTKTVEDVEWRCGSLLAPDPKQVAAALLTPDSAELPAAVAF